MLTCAGISMAMGMEVLALPMTVNMEMHALAPGAQQDVSAKCHEHESDREFKRVCSPLHKGEVDQQQCPAERQQRQTVAYAPDGTVPRGFRKLAVASAETGDSREVIGLEGVLQAQ
jgi:hypothetical protein